MLETVAIVTPVRDDAGELVDLRYAYVNDALCASTGRPREQLVGRLDSEFTADFAGTARFAAFREVLTTGVPTRIETAKGPRPRSGGAADERVLTLSIVPLGDALMVTGTDVSDRHALHAELGAGERQLRDVIDTVFESVAILSPVRNNDGDVTDLRFDYVNERYAEMVGFGRDELLGSKVGEHFPGFPHTGRFGLYLQVMRTGAATRTDELTGDVAGTGTGIEGRVIDAVVAPLGPNLLVTARYMTERRQAEHELELRAELLDMAHDAVIVRDPVESRITYWNREAQTVYGYAPEEAQGQVTHQLLATRFPESLEALDRALHQDGHWAGVLHHRRRDGATLVISSRQALLRHPDGAPRAIIELNSDITKRHDAELHIEELNRSLRRRAAELDAANHELESFAYSVAHDLRGPLRAVAGFTDLLERRGHISPDDEAGRALVLRVTRAAARMGELIEALLELAQLSRCEIHLRHVDISAVVREIGDELRAAERQRDVELVVEDGLHLDGDARLMRILMRSLLENAWKYSGGRERARIEVARHNGATIVVRDNGAGFDMAFADQLFKPFGRLHRQDEFPGTGVGLATAARIVGRHGGTLTAEGRVGEGAAFFVSLPDQSTGGGP